MDGDDLHRALRRYHDKRLQELLELLYTTDDIQRVRGQIKELKVSIDKLKEIMNTTGVDDDE